MKDRGALERATRKPHFNGFIIGKVIEARVVHRMLWISISLKFNGLGCFLSLISKDLHKLMCEIKPQTQYIAAQAVLTPYSVLAMVWGYIFFLFLFDKQGRFRV